MERHVPTSDEVDAFLHVDRNWGRWGPDEQIGAMNLVTPTKRVAAARLVRSGRTVSISRPYPKTPATNNPNPAQHFMRRGVREPRGGSATDYYGISYHGVASTHLDALCHVWDEAGMYNGRNPNDVVQFDGVTFGSVDNWKDGIVTRGVLLDVPKHRGVPYVTHDAPVHGWELEDIAKEQGVALEPGDAILVYSGREKFSAAEYLWGSNPTTRPGLHASCLKFVRESDCCLLAWDMMDLWPHGYDIPWSVHAVIFAYGVALVDNALLEPLAEACAEEGRYEFFFTLAPLRVAGGTGSPINPIAVF